MFDNWHICQAKIIQHNFRRIMKRVFMLMFMVLEVSQFY